MHSKNKIFLSNTSYSWAFDQNDKDICYIKKPIYENSY